MKRAWPAALLAWIAGFVDCLGYLALSKVFTAHMSGNAAAVGAELGTGNLKEVMAKGLAIPAFMLGIALGVLAETFGQRSRLRGRLSHAFVLEIAVLLCFLVLDPRLPRAVPPEDTPAYFLRLLLLALAMGVQSATLRRAGGLSVNTTFVTGMLTNMTTNAVQYLLKFRHAGSGSQAASDPDSHQQLGRRAALFGLIFFSFLIGGVCGGFGETRWGSITLLAPIAGLVVVTLVDWVRPRGLSAD